MKLDVASSRTVVAASPEVPEAEYPGINGSCSNRACMVRQDEDIVSQTTRATKTPELGPTMFAAIAAQREELKRSYQRREVEGQASGLLNSPKAPLA